VLPDGLLLNDQAPGRGDSAVQELAEMLHGHLIGEMTLGGGMSPAAWHTFLGLLARSPDDIRSQGGIVRAWMAAGGGPIELRQIDYGDVLRERKGALAGGWDEIVTSYLEGEFSDLDDKAMAALLDIAGDTSRFRDFAERLVAQAEESGERVKKDLVLRIFQALAELDMAQAAAEAMPFARQPEFSDLWKSAAHLLRSYSDANWVSDEYGRELASARTHAVDVERVSDDPPERISSWLSTVSDVEVRRLDQQVLLDLLVLETRPEAWQRVLDSSVGSIDNLVLTGGPQAILSPVDPRTLGIDPLTYL
jgi:hypothetical protein